MPGSLILCPSPFPSPFPSPSTCYHGAPRMAPPGPRWPTGGATLPYRLSSSIASELGTIDGDHVCDRDCSIVRGSMALVYLPIPPEVMERERAATFARDVDGVPRRKCAVQQTRHPPPPPPVATAIGPLLRQWRRTRQLSQLALALAAQVSTRHLS